jgi:glycosyltransferase involved in cell wall biosynthesis
MPTASVLIPVHNGAATVEQAIVSVLAQDLDNIELLVCDDGSTDGTVAVVRSFEDPRLRLLTNPENLGVGATRNRLIAEARGEWIAFLDADDVFLPGKLTRCLRELEQAGGDALAHRMHYITRRGLRGTLPARPYFSSAFVVRASLARSVPGYREDLRANQEPDFFDSLGTVRILKERLGGYRLRNDSITDRLWFDKRLAAHWYDRNPRRPAPPDLRAWYRGEHGSLRRGLLVTSWYGQRCGRRAAVHLLEGEYLRAAGFAALSVICNPLYLAHRAWVRLLPGPVRGEGLPTE